MADIVLVPMELAQAKATGDWYLRGLESSHTWWVGLTLPEWVKKLARVKEEDNET